MSFLNKFFYSSSNPSSDSNLETNTQSVNNLIDYVFSLISQKDSVKKEFLRYQKIKEIKNSEQRDFAYVKLYFQLENFILANNILIKGNIIDSKLEFRAFVSEHCDVNSLPLYLKLIFMPANLQATMLYVVGLQKLINHFRHIIGNAKIQSIFKFSTQGTLLSQVSLKDNLLISVPNIDLIAGRSDLSEIKNSFRKIYSVFFETIIVILGEFNMSDEVQNIYISIADSYDQELLSIFLEVIPEDFLESEKSSILNLQKLEQALRDRALELENNVLELEKSKSVTLDLLKTIEEEKKKVELIVEERTHDLRAEQARLLASINSIPFGFFIADIDNRIIMTNKMMVNMFKLTSTENLFLSDINKLFGNNFDISSLVESCVKGKRVCEVKQIILGSKIFRGIIAPIVSVSDNSEAIGYVFILEDVTEAIALERSRDEFFSIASHELRTPLTAISGNAQLIQDHFKGREEDKEFSAMVDDIYDSSIRLIDIVNDFLEVSKLEQGRIKIKKEKFDLSEVISKVINTMTEMANKKGLKINYSSQIPSPIYISTDKYKVEQIMFNLLGNALKFTSKGGVSIIVEPIPNFIKIKVIDTGIGISEQNKSLLFRKFQQAGEHILARDFTQGTGLGLYISHLLTSKLGGTIDLESSTLGEGSTFVFTLPLATQ